MSWQFVAAYLRNYCANCTLTGFSYIANRNLHYTERIFWLVCVILSALGSYHLIIEYEQEFESKAVSIVYESLLPNEKVSFPAIGVCEPYIMKEISDELEEYVQSLGEEYVYEVETHVAFIVFPHEYHRGVIQTRCLPSVDCEKCTKCPLDGYRQISAMLSFNCSNYFVHCAVGGKAFDCCQYFRPLITPVGQCFLLNSLLNNKPGSSNWLPLEFSRADDGRSLQLFADRPMQVNIFNAEDLPFKSLPYITISARDSGQHKTVQVYVENMINDPDVRDVSPSYRKCRFPDERLPHSVYAAYSFSTCLSDCIRGYQLKLCNCTLFSLLPDVHAAIPECSFSGYLCLDAAAMLEPDIKLFLPWGNPNFTCDCLPSCSEHYFRIIYEELTKQKAELLRSIGAKRSTRSVTVELPLLPTERYRRQALRTRLDVVVTIGGIMGLFMGASILSGIEVFYYFTLRVVNNVRRGIVE